jgi:hypothetical protein
MVRSNLRSMRAAIFCSFEVNARWGESLANAVSRCGKFAQSKGTTLLFQDDGRPAEQFGDSQSLRLPPVEYGLNNLRREAGQRQDPAPATTSSTTKWPTGARNRVEIERAAIPLTGRTAPRRVARTQIGTRV